MATEPKPPDGWNTWIGYVLVGEAGNRAYVAFATARAELAALREENAKLRNQLAEADEEVRRMERLEAL